ncbi:MAG TPA: beta-propeller domain-containing protein [Nitrososphaerales archaeon]|nr:beta-propeller domain-containing protein [Nitrososphaerales archaeon]
MQAESKVGGGNRATMVFFVTILVVAAAFAVYSVLPAHKAQPGVSAAGATPQGLSSFQSYYQLQAFVAANAKSAQEYDRYGGAGFIGGPLMLAGGIGLPVEQIAGVAAPGAVAAVAAGSQSSPAFTGTNVQVQGVDEPDIVKTDGTHLFVAANGTGSSSSAGSVTIMDAYPPNSTSVLSTVSLPNSQILGIEVAQGRLLVIDQRYTNTTYVGLLLYNTSTLSSPSLMENETVSGNYVAARLAQGYLYAVVQQPSYQFDGRGNATGVLPFVTANGEKTALSPPSVYYTPNNSQIGDYTMIISIGMASGAATTLSVLTGPSSTVFVSTSNIYVVYSNYRLYADADNIPGDVFSGGVITSPSAGQEQNSTIFRASYTNGTVAVQAVGSVPGSVLNQFSMNEYDGYFQVATSRIATINGNATESDDVYVLNSNMSQVSALQNIAPGENLYAVRFVGDMGYVVTFEQIDPLFAISFADMTHPVILSALKVNGYSDYLQPLFSNYLLGVGKDTVASSTGDFAYYLGLKLSLFHVAANGSSSDVQDYLIGDRGTDSPVLTNHLALTWDPANNVTVMPVLLAKVSANQQGSSQNPPPEGNPVWQGAYVFRVDSSGFTLLGNVTQYPAGMNYGDSPNNNLQVERSVIIGNYLYTISQSEVMVSDLSSFGTVATVALPGS